MTVIEALPQQAPDASVNSDVHTTLMKLLAYCERNQWAGYEPYDVLNSPVFEKMSLLKAKLPRLVLTQAFKRSPVNLRSLLRIPKTQNPKAVALFLSAFLKLTNCGMPFDKAQVELMIQRLDALRSRETPYWCWGYNFPWQTRRVLVPRWSPNLVCTAFAAMALLDVFEQSADGRCLEMANSAAEFLFNELYWTEGNCKAGFAYPLPSVRPQIYNANLLASALLCRVHRHRSNPRFLDAALRATRYCVGKQRADGSWLYGEAPGYAWIDNFHTGFNLNAVQDIGRYAGTSEFEASLQHGFEFYRRNFIRDDGAVRYFHDRDYPMDTHCVAQTIITLVAFRNLSSDNLALAHTVFEWALKHLWDERGFFYYRVLRSCTIRTSYMRWSQAWMCLALASLLPHRDSATVILH